jgi:hypothetical protein
MHRGNVMNSKERKELIEKIETLEKIKKEHPPDEKLLDEMIETYKEKLKGGEKRYE